MITTIYLFFTNKEINPATLVNKTMYIISSTTIDISFKQFLAKAFFIGDSKSNNKSITKSNGFIISSLSYPSFLNSNLIYTKPYLIPNLANLFLIV